MLMLTYVVYVVIILQAQFWNAWLNGKKKKMEIWKNKFVETKRRYSRGNSL